MDVKEKIISLIRLKGPVLPVQAAKEIESSILMASAHLSEMASNKQLKVSNIKFGSSPLYYLPGQEARLEQFSSNLQEKEKRAYDMLRQKKVLRDSEIGPVMRVAARAIKDFAIPLQVNYKGNKEIFWKWHSLSKEETEGIVREQLKEPKEAPKEEKQEKLKEPIKEETPAKKIIEKPKDDFFNEIQGYFNKNNIKIIEQKVIRKNADLNFIVEVPSSVGNLRYYCVAKSKKNVNDGDLSSAYIKAQSKKLPVLFLTKGELTKKAKEIMEKEFKGMVVKKI